MKKRKNLNVWLEMSMFLLLMVSTATAEIIFVDADATGVNDGSSWTDAYKFLQDALADADSSPKPVEIRVAQGIYKPDEDSAHPNGTGSRTATFQLKNGVAIYGGFPPGGGTWEERDPNDPNNETILSGDLLGNDGPDFANNYENSYHVVNGSGTDETVVLDGFTITAGNAKFSPSYEDPRKYGGGMFCNRGSPTLTNCTFTGNTGYYGGGMLNWRSSSPTLTNCTFSGNNAFYFGGGMCNWDSNPTLTNCTFSGNSADYGGGMYNARSSPTVTNCVFSGNSAGNRGGGVCNRNYSSPTVTNCTFSGNSANYGGGMNNVSSSPTIRHCTILDSILGSHDSHITMSHCIQWDGITIFWGGLRPSDITISYSDVKGGFSGEGNINADPCFVDAAAGDYHLSPCSPCINVGDPCYSPSPGETDIDGEPRVINGCVDMGADEVNYEGPIIEIWPTEFTFYALQGVPNPPGQVLSIRNNGFGTLSWEVTEDCPWLQVDPTNGISTGDINEVILSVDISGLDGGPYACELSITAVGTLNSPLMVPVNLEVHGELHVPAKYPTIQAAIDAAWEGDTVIVAPGIYTGPGNREIDFRGKAITVRSIEPNDPNVVAATMIDCYHRYYEYRGFYFHSGEGEDSRLEGFTIANGRKSTSGGAGIYCWQSSPTISNCVFTDNYACHGGGMYCTDSNSVLINCKFIENSAYRSGGGICAVKSNLTLINCIFNINSAGFGGAMCSSSHHPGWPRAIINATTHWDDRINNSYNSPTLVHCTFMANSAGYGGAIANVETSTTFTNCIFIANKAQSNGGGMYNRYRSSPMLTNCTFAGNSALNGDALACESYYPGPPGNVLLTNCILWDGGDEIWNEDGSTITISYSDIQGGQMAVYDPCESIIWSTGNIDADPCFVETGYWDANGVWIEGDYHLLEDSPCIDTGDPNYIAEPNETDLDGRPRVISGRIDMGAYEYSPPIPAEVRIVPRTINLASKGKWITSLFWLPEDYDVADIEPNSVLLEGEIEPEWFSVDEQQQIVIVRFSRSEVQGILNAGQVELTISGELMDGTVFEGTDVIRVIDKSGGKSAR